MPDLFTPLTLRETTLRNRVMVSPMCQYSCEDRDGLATDWHLVHLGSRAVGGAGVVMAEATAVEPRGRISPEDLGVWSAEHAAALAPVAEFVRAQGSVPAIQLAHAGRKASTRRPFDGRRPLQPDEGGWTVRAPGSEPYPYEKSASGGEAPPTERMDRDDVADVVAAFATAAEHALAAGFEVAEVHGAHGYLLHEFLSPVTNDRDDAYGGDFEGRTRLLREVIEAVRDVWPDDAPVFVRLSATDWLPDRPSWDLDQTKRVAELLPEWGADLLDVSAGGIHPDQRPPEQGPGYQIRYGRAVREHCRERGVDLAVGAVGGIRSPEQADALVRADRADVAVVGRRHLYDPYFTLHAADALDADPDPPVPKQYRRGF